ncbi:MAG: 4Fe-4S binding protein [Anaerolineales bacterium]|nr:4Fe-4S binding protein [Anaerolineales bacterium]
MASRYAFSIDLDRCIGCQACVVACRTGNEVASGDAYITVSEEIRRKDNGFWGSFAHKRCFHCTEAPCVEVCPTGTLTKVNGLTAVDMAKCSACGYCTQACPFHIPHVVDNHVSKCVGCLDQVQAGEEPWCARTCPSNAIRFGEREVILAEAKAKVAKLRERYPNAQVYGETQLGGLGLLMVLLEAPGVYGLPEAPQSSATIQTWKTLVKPASAGLTALAAGVMGLAFVFARRQHAKEHAEVHTAAPVEAAVVETPAQTEENHD